MTIHKCIIPPPTFVADVADATDSAGLTLRMAYQQRLAEKGRKETELVDWENEGGSLAAPAGVPQSSGADWRRPKSALPGPD